MPLHNSDSLIIETDTAAESLPDPGTVPNRTHLLVNTGSATAVWSAPVGFTEGGINVATISVLAGRSKLVRSNGTRWAVAPAQGIPHIEANTVTTAANGMATFNFAVPFAATPSVTIAGQTASNDLTEVRIQSVSTTSVTVHARSATTVTILGIQVVAFPTNASGLPVHIIASDKGAFGV